jgi:hypothetical protein
MKEVPCPSFSIELPDQGLPSFAGDQFRRRGFTSFDHAVPGASGTDDHPQWVTTRRSQRFMIILGRGQSRESSARLGRSPASTGRTISKGAPNVVRLRGHSPYYLDCYRVLARQSRSSQRSQLCRLLPTESLVLPARPDPGIRRPRPPYGHRRVTNVGTVGQTRLAPRARPTTKGAMWSRCLRRSHRNHQVHRELALPPRGRCQRARVSVGNHGHWARHRRTSPFTAPLPGRGPAEASSET